MEGRPRSGMEVESVQLVRGSVTVVDAFVLLLSCALVGEIGECYLRDRRVLYGNHYCFNKKWRKEQWGLRLSQSFLHDVISHYLSDRP